jgi:pimeloyl-ACP methyl ester carboxylesterase
VTLPENQTVGVTVFCGYVVVPENRSMPDGSTVSLATMVFKSTAANPNPVPLIYLQGGPGGAALPLFSSGQLDSALTAVLAERDLIVFDQRGNGSSLPSLDCPEVTQVEAGQPDVLVSNLEQFEPVPSSAVLAARLEATTKCRDRLARSGVDLDDFSSAANAADVNDVRVALGYSKLDLYGISYGTRVALTVMRDFPQIVNSANLDGVAPAGTDWVALAPVSVSHGYRSPHRWLHKGCSVRRRLAESGYSLLWTYR